MKLDLENDNVFEIETTVSKVRSYFDGVDIGTVLPGFSDKLDEAQAYPTMNDGKECFLIIRIK